MAEDNKNTLYKPGHPTYEAGHRAMRALVEVRNGLKSIYSDDKYELEQQWNGCIESIVEEAVKMSHRGG